ncbi:MAG: hypothetical protein AB9834_04430 [Lentimicrobium sp.]
MTKKEKANQMTELAIKWKESGLSQRAFALEHGLKLAKFRYRIRKQHNLEHEGTGFIQIGGRIGLRFPNGVELSLPLHTPVNIIRSLVQAF